MTKVNPINGHEARSNIFPWLICKSDTIFFLIKKILNYFNDFKNRNFSFLLLQLNQIIEMKQSQTFFHWMHSNLIAFFIGDKILKYFNDFYNWNLSIHCKSEQKQVK